MLSRVSARGTQRIAAWITTSLLLGGCAGEPVESAPAPDPIVAEAGFVDVPPRDVTVNGQPVSIAARARLFYNLRPADDHPEDKPILVLFNGFAAEVVRSFGTGPTTVAEGGDVVDNPWSLTKVANLLYVEPRQSGYSYDVIADRKPTWNDCFPAIFNEYVDAADVLFGVLSFLDSHPRLKGPVHWVGESYAGVRIQWLLAYLRGRWDLAPYQDKALEQALEGAPKDRPLAASQILLQPWLLGAAHAAAIQGVCGSEDTIAKVSASTGADCTGLNACACANDAGRSLYNYVYTDEHQRKREFEASEAHTVPERAAALLGVELTKVDGLAAPDRRKGFKCDQADSETPPEDDLVKLLGALQTGQSYYLGYAPLQPGKEIADFTPDWRAKNLIGAAFVDNLRDVPTFVTDGPLDLVVPTSALAPGLEALLGPDHVDASAGLSVVTADGARAIEIHRYPSAGHMITMLEPEAFSKDVAAWLASPKP
ncbi:MAG: hypothetical protein U0441_17030 [Polyangiaceae bacterium]